MQLHVATRALGCAAASVTAHEGRLLSPSLYPGAAGLPRDYLASIYDIDYAPAGDGQCKLAGANVIEENRRPSEGSGAPAEWYVCTEKPRVGAGSCLISSRQQLLWRVGAKVLASTHLGLPCVTFGAGVAAAELQRRCATCGRRSLVGVGHFHHGRLLSIPGRPELHAAARGDNVRKRFASDRGFGRARSTDPFGPSSIELEPAGTERARVWRG